MKIERENVIRKIKFNNNLEFELGELNRNEESDYHLELCINIVKNDDNNYSICFYDNSEFYSFEFNEEGDLIE
jgi:hypothetical protein